MHYLATLFILLCFSFKALALAPSENCNEVRIKAGNIESICEQTNNIICQKIPTEDRRVCSDLNSASDESAWNFFLRCSNGVISGVKSFWDMIKGAFNAVKDLVIDSSKREAASDIASELTSSLGFLLRELVAHPIEFSNGLRKKLMATLETEFNEFSCYKPTVKVEKSCQFFSELLMPPIGLGMLLFKGGKNVVKLSKLSKGNSAVGLNPKEVELLLTRHKGAINEFFPNGLSERDLTILTKLRKQLENGELTKDGKVLTESDFKKLLSEFSVCKLK